MEIQGGVHQRWEARASKGLEILAGALRLLLSVIIPSTEMLLKGAGPEGIFFFFSEQAFLLIMIYEDLFLNMAELVKPGD